MSCQHDFRARLRCAVDIREEKGEKYHEPWPPRACHAVRFISSCEARRKKGKKPVRPKSKAKRRPLGQDKLLGCPSPAIGCQPKTSPGPSAFQPRPESQQGFRTSGPEELRPGHRGELPKLGSDQPLHLPFVPATRLTNPGMSDFASHGTIAMVARPV